MAVVAATSMACTTWKAQPLPGLVPIVYPPLIRVHRVDGTVMEIAHAVADRDSVIGMSSLRGDALRVAVATRDVATVEGIAPARVRTWLLITAIGAFAVAWGLESLVSGWEWEWDPGEHAL